MKSIILSCLICILFITEVTAVETWVVKTPMLSAKSVCGLASVDSFIYCIGGHDVSGLAVNSVYAYNVYTDVWTTKTPMPTARGELGVAQVGGKIYAIGGFTSVSGALNAVEEYDPATDTWTVKTAMPTARSQFSVAAIGGKIYAIGGYPGSYTELEIYDPATDTWTTGNPMTFGRIQANGAAAMNGKLYFLGGKSYSNTVYYDSCSIYDPITDMWSTGTNMPFARFEGSIAYANSRIYYFGGAIGTTVNPTIPNYNTNVYFDSVSGTWVTALACLDKRSSGAAIRGANGKIYLMGGFDSLGNSVDWNHEYTPDYLTTDVRPVEINKHAKVYPIPCDNQLFIDVSTFTGDVSTLNMYNVSGQRVQVPFYYSEGVLSVDTKRLSPGVYVLQGSSTAGETYKETVVIK